MSIYDDEAVRKHIHRQGMKRDEHGDWIVRCPACGADAYYEYGPDTTAEGSPYRCTQNHCFYSRDAWEVV